MLLVVGLGNPGKKYSGNRHNVGFMAVDALRDREGWPDYKEKFSGVFTRGMAFATEVVALRPMTFMNVSGDCVQPAVAFFKVAPAELVVVHDELDIPFGEVRLKFGGGHAGHNGLRSIIARLGTADFLRVRVGVGRPPPDFQGDVADYVLSDFDPSQRAEIPGLLSRALDAIARVAKDGPGAAMNTVNTKKK